MFHCACFSAHKGRIWEHGLDENCTLYNCICQLLHHNFVHLYYCCLDQMSVSFSGRAQLCQAYPRVCVVHKYHYIRTQIHRNQICNVYNHSQSVLVYIVWLGLPGIALNYYLACFMLIWQSGSTGQLHWCIHMVQLQCNIMCECMPQTSVTSVEYF